MAKRQKTLYVGMTGHRPNRMPKPHWRRIVRDLGKVMAQIELTHPGRRPMLLSGIAEGADRLAAYVALARGWPLYAILAFDRARFEEEFADPSAIGEFRALLRAADVLEEPGSRLPRAVGDGYAAVGQRLLAACDLLIAVWDGRASRGKGGTVDIIEGALVRGIPVIWIHARKLQAPKRLSTKGPATFGRAAVGERASPPTR
jgi:hypothetical protein